jgi:hypothetical protein
MGERAGAVAARRRRQAAAARPTLKTAAAGAVGVLIVVAVLYAASSGSTAKEEMRSGHRGGGGGGSGGVGGVGGGGVVAAAGRTGEASNALEAAASLLLDSMGGDLAAVEAAAACLELVYENVTRMTTIEVAAVEKSDGVDYMCRVVGAIKSLLSSIDRAPLRPAVPAVALMILLYETHLPVGLTVITSGGVPVLVDALRCPDARGRGGLSRGDAGGAARGACRCSARSLPPRRHRACRPTAVG